MNSEIGRMAFKEPSHSTWISDDTISYWAGFGRQVCKCLEQALQIGSGVAGTASTLSLHVVSATRRLATDVLLPLCPLALNYGVNHLVEKSLEKPAVGQIALGAAVW